MKSFLSGILLLLCLYSTATLGQSSKKLTPIEYNDFLVSSTDSLNAMGVEWGNLFSQIYGGDHNFSKLKPIRQKLNAFIIIRKNDIEKMPVVGVGGEGIKQAVISFLDFEMSMIENAFLAMEQLDANSSDNEIEAAINKLTDNVKSEEAVLSMVRAAQTAYGKQNNFTIDSEE